MFTRSAWASPACAPGRGRVPFSENCAAGGDRQNRPRGETETPSRSVLRCDWRRPLSFKPERAQSVFMGCSDIT
ncbi:hypothetical protein QQF64_005371 [Cirrhinus molitorella]|uniref:Uncharacterized protein n=1 Tax=Cirrhinus molitorella TaxID=172907 RepID=A0ABR3MFC3_9TELE